MHLRVHFEMRIIAVWILYFWLGLADRANYLCFFNLLVLILLLDPRSAQQSPLMQLISPLMNHIPHLLLELTFSDQFDYF